MKTSNYTQNHQDRVNAIVERDALACANLRGLQLITGRRILNAETPDDEEAAALIYQNVSRAIVGRALRRHRLANAPAHGPLNPMKQALNLALRRVKATAAR